MFGEGSSEVSCNLSLGVRVDFELRKLSVASLEFAITLVHVQGAPLIDLLEPLVRVSAHEVQSLTLQLRALAGPLSLVLGCVLLRKEERVKPCHEA